MDAQQVPTEKKLSKAALVGIILSALGMCFFPLALAGGVLGVIGIVNTSNDKNLGGKVLAIVAICLVPMSIFTSIFTTGVIAAIAIPNFVKFQARSKQSECKVNLKGMFTAEKSYFMAHDAYFTKAGEGDFILERGNRYAYFFAPGPVQGRSAIKETSVAGATGFGVDSFKYPAQRRFAASDLPAALDGGAQLGITGKCPACTITMACIGEISATDNHDTWSISTADRQGADGETIPAGTPFNDSRTFGRGL